MFRLYSKSYRRNPLQLEIRKTETRKLKESNNIRNSNSHIVSPIVTVREKDGSIRLCADSR